MSPISPQVHCPICGILMLSAGPYSYKHECSAHDRDRLHRLEAENGNLRAVAATARLLSITLGQYLSEKGKIDVTGIEKEVRIVKKILIQDLRTLEEEANAKT